MMKVVADRKMVAQRLAELTGDNVVYTRVPRCAYIVGQIAFEHDSSITVAEDADRSQLMQLAEEGLIDGFEGITAPAINTDRQDQALEGDEGDEAPYTENENTSDTLTISLPLAGHTANSLRNLVTMVYARGPLLSKATGGSFSCTEQQVIALHDCATVSDVMTLLTGDLVGIVIDHGCISFTGFPFPEEPVRTNAFSVLAAQMCKAAMKQKRVNRKQIEVPSERYLFRSWLLALGMHGEEFADARRILLASLSGKAAFKDAAMEERWRMRQQEKCYRQV